MTAKNSIVRASILALTVALAVAGAARPAVGAPREAPGGYEQGLRAALDLHDEASDLAGEQEALKAFEAVVAEFPEAWLPRFWASYLQTQVGRLEKPFSKVDAYLARAEAHLAKAKSLAGEKASSRDRAAMEVLQALIYSFLAIRKDDDAHYKPLEKEAVEAAVRLDPTSPTLLTWIGVGHIAKARADKDLSLAATGKVLLERAREIFEETEDRSASTDMNSEWIPFWLPMAEAAIADEGEGEDGS